MPAVSRFARRLVPVLALALPSFASAQAVTPAPLSSGEVTFAMRATKVNDFVGHAPVSRAEFHGDQVARVTGFAEVRLVDMATGIGLRDRHMRNAMRADSFPIIRFDLTGVQPGTQQGDSIPAVLDGRMTIHGVTRPIRVNGMIVIRGGQTELIASFPLDMREYGIDPPSRFFGAVKVAPVTTVGVSLRFGA
jgi:polyisoprenoid-binding protein YceI